MLSALVTMEVECLNRLFQRNVLKTGIRLLQLTENAVLYELSLLPGEICQAGLKNRYWVGKAGAERRRGDFYLIGEQNKV